VLLKGNGWAATWPEVWPLLIFLLAVMTIAVARFRRTLD
jgi:ABC-2 type transport system permease protein